MNPTENPIEKIMSEAMDRIKSIIDVDTIVGSPIISENGNIVVPVSKVSVGFVAGGGEYLEETFKKTSRDYPFAGGSGVGFSVTPIGFLSVNNGEVKMISAENKINPYENLTDLIAKLLDALATAVKDKKD